MSEDAKHPGYQSAFVAVHLAELDLEKPDDCLSHGHADRRRAGISRHGSVTTSLPAPLASFLSSDRKVSTTLDAAVRMKVASLVTVSIRNPLSRHLQAVSTLGQWMPATRLWLRQLLSTRAISFASGPVVASSPGGKPQETAKSLGPT